MDLARICRKAVQEYAGVPCGIMDQVGFGTDRGLIASRMTGDVFGGSTISLVRKDAAPELCAHLKKSFEARFGCAIEPFVTIASGGAKIVS